MNSKVWSRKALSACLVIALYVTCSMVALANNDKIAGELIVNGNAKVTVNGEVAQNGRSIFSASTITTPENSSASIHLGKLGNLELAPNSSLTVNFDQNGVTGNLTAGSVNVNAAAEKTVVINTANGTVSSATAGNMFTASAEKGAMGDDDDNNKKKKGGAAWWVWTLVFAGAATGILWAALSDSNDAQIGGGGTVVSPNR